MKQNISKPGTNPGAGTGTNTATAACIDNCPDLDLDLDLYGRKTNLLIRNIRIENKPAEIYIENGLISSVGEKIKDHDAEFILDGDRATALPGLYNMHTHAPMSLLRGYSDDLELFEWLSTLIWPTEAHLTSDDLYWGTKLACLEMVRTGTTFFNDMYFGIESIARAADESGMRACLSYATVDNGDADKRASELQTTRDAIRAVRARNNPRLLTAVAPHAVYTVSGEGLSALAELAEEEDTFLHVHVSETQKEVTDCIADHGMSPVAWLDKCGVLSPRCLAAHSCWLDANDVELYAKRGVTAVMNPVSNMKLASGKMSPYRELVNAGANVALGTDGASSNNSLDMFEEMKVASIAQKLSTNDPTIMPAAEALKVASFNGAKAMGLKGGLLAPGYLADIILVERNPSSVPAFSTTSNAVYATCGKDVATTICDGVVLMHDKYIPGMEEIMAKAEAVAFNLAERAGVRK
ncbi:MAG TPA: amidohydrolase [Methanocorpusculum sp.]|nr:amidohydrolase [Methanocorpusculum sp.]